MADYISVHRAADLNIEALFHIAAGFSELCPPGRNRRQTAFRRFNMAFEEEGVGARFLRTFSIDSLPQAPFEEKP